MGVEYIGGQRKWPVLNDCGMSGGQGGGVVEAITGSEVVPTRDILSDLAVK